MQAMYLKRFSGGNLFWERDVSIVTWASVLVILPSFPRGFKVVLNGHHCKKQKSGMLLKCFLNKTFERCTLKTVTRELAAWAPHTFNKAMKMKTSLDFASFLPEQTWTWPVVFMSFLNGKENQCELLLLHSYLELNLSCYFWNNSNPNNLVLNSSEDWQVQFPALEAT